MRKNRGAAAVVAGALAAAVFIGLGAAMIRASAPAFDEALHLVSGYAALRGAPVPPGWRTHPRFAQEWAALPLLVERPELPPAPAEGNLYLYGDALMRRSGAAAERVLDSARLWSLASWAIVLAAALFAWAGRLGGPSAALASAPFLALCPPLLAQFAFVSPDPAATTLFFVSVWLLSMRPRRAAAAALGGAAAGLCLASAYAMVLLPALALTAMLLEGRLIKGGEELEGAPLLWAGAGAATALVSAYAFHPGEYFRDFLATLQLVSRGWPSYAAGRISQDGFLWYFPLALAVKTPVPLLLCSATGAVALSRRSPREALWLLLPPSAYVAAACFSRTQDGYRHVLLAYPFMIVLAGAGLLEIRRLRPAAGWALLAWLAVGTLLVHPHYLAYFNELAGGPRNGHNVLVDSDLDWGQGLKALAQELHRRGDPPIYLSYMGTADPAAYGIRYVPVDMITSVPRRAAAVASAPRLFAISATNLHGLYYDDPARFAWLRSRAPAYRAADSIFLYDLSADADALARLASSR